MTINKLAIVYWSGTVNTETMANRIAEGAKEAGVEVELMGPSSSLRRASLSSA